MQTCFSVLAEFSASDLLQWAGLILCYVGGLIGLVALSAPLSVIAYARKRTYPSATSAPDCRIGLAIFTIVMLYVGLIPFIGPVSPWHLLIPAICLPAFLWVDRSTHRSLVGSLSHGDPQVRRASAARLGRQRDRRAIPHLTSLVADADPEVRADAVESLGRVARHRGPDEMVATALAPAINDIVVEVRRRAAAALRRVGGAVAEQSLATLLLDEDAPTRRTAAEALSDPGRATPGDTVRANMLAAMGKFEEAAALGPAAEAALVLAANDPDRVARGKALSALGRLASLGATKAVQKLIAATRDPEPLVRREATEGLGRARGATVIKALLRVLSEDQDAIVRSMAASALQACGDETAVSALVHAMTKDEDTHVRDMAAYALGHKGGLAAVTPLLNAVEILGLESAASALYWVKAPGVSQLLADAVKSHPIAAARQLAASRLADLGDALALPALTAALNDADGGVRRAAAEALVKARQLPEDPAARAKLLITAGRLEQAEKCGLPAIRPLLAAMRELSPHVPQGQAEAPNEVERALLKLLSAYGEEVTTVLKDVMSEDDPALHAVASRILDAHGVATAAEKATPARARQASGGSSARTCPVCGSSRVVLPMGRGRSAAEPNCRNCGYNFSGTF